MSTANLIKVPTCPVCGGIMRLRNGQFDKFWGCSNFAKTGCRGTRNFVVRQKNDRSHIIGSPEQDAIWDAIVNGDGHIVVNALAGTGKTFTCQEAMLRVAPELKVLYLAFGRENVKEFQDKAPSNCRVKTLNSMGNEIILRNYKNVVIEDNKLKAIVANLWTPKTAEELENKDTINMAVVNLVDLCQGYLLDGRNEDELFEIAVRHEVEYPAEFSDLIHGLVPLALEADAGNTAIISYNDQIWFPNKLNLRGPKFDLIFVDEAQDLNRCQHHLAMRLLTPNGRMVIVGDNNQAIFGFRGSDVNSIPNFTKLLKETGKKIHELPLTVTRRCCKAVTRFAQQWVENLKCLPDAPEGEIVYTNLAEASAMYMPNDMLICRTNAPLISIAYSLIKAGKKAVIRGRDIGEGLVSLVKKLKPKSVNDLLVKLDTWTAKECEKYKGTRNEETKTQQITDKVECIRAFAEGSETVAEIVSNIKKLYADFSQDGKRQDAISLSSIHRAKGLEAERVFWIMPAITCKGSQEWQQQQEVHLKYVGATRAKRYLALVAEK